MEKFDVAIGDSLKLNTSYENSGYSLGDCRHFVHKIRKHSPYLIEIYVRRNDFMGYLVDNVINTYLSTKMVLTEKTKF